MPKAKPSSASKVLPQTSSKSHRSGGKSTKPEPVPIKKSSRPIKKDAKQTTPENSQSSAQSSKKDASKNKSKYASQAISSRSRDNKHASKKNSQREPDVQPAQTAFELFSTKIWQMYKDDDKFQSCSRSEKKEIVKKSWSKLTTEKKRKYESKAIEDQKRFEKESRAQKKRKVSVSDQSQSESEEESEDEQPKRSAKKSPDASYTQSGKKIKKPMSKYNAFCKIITPQLKEENPDLSFGELATKIAKEYKNITDDQLTEVNRIIKEDQKRYDRDMRDAPKTAPPVSKSQKSVEKKVEEQPQQVMPKKPTTGFFAFINRNRERLKKENPDKSVCEIGKLAGQEWQAMTDEEKKAYDKYVEQDQKRYQKELDQLNSKGYFINSDGVKSTDLKVKQKKGSVSPSTQDSTRSVPKGLTNYKEGTMLPKNIRSPFFFFSAECWEKIKTNRKEGELFNYIQVTKDNAEKWKNLTEKQRKKYQDLYEADKQRREDQIEQIKKKGYFMTEEGIKSTDLPVQKLKNRRPRTPKEAEDEAQD